jgi:hypothetical protein
MTRHVKTKQDKTRQDKERQDKTRQGRTGLDNRNQEQHGAKFKKVDQGREKILSFFGGVDYDWLRGG